MIVHEPASTEAHEAEDIPAAEPTAAEDIGHDDNVEDDEVLPQIEHNVVSSPVLTNSKLISIGRPLTPIAQDASWADHPQQQDSPSTPQQQQQATPPVQEEDEDFEAQPTPSPKALPAFRRLRKGQRPQVPLSSVPEGEVQRSPVARQVFSEPAPTVNVSESEAHAAEDIPAASAEENQEEVRVPTPPVIEEEAVPNVNVPVPDPPVRQEEVDNVEAATANANEANDIVMADANVEPAPTSVPEASVGTEPETTEAAAPEANETIAPEAPVVQLDASTIAPAPVPPPRPHTIEQAYSHGQLTTVRWPILEPPPTASGPQFDYHIEHRPQVQNPRML